MKATTKTSILNVIIGIMLFAIAISKFYLFGIRFNPILPFSFFIILGISFVTRYFLQPNKKAIDTTKMILVALWCFLNSASLLRFPSLKFLVITLMILGSIWLFQEFIQQVKNPKSFEEFNWLRNIGLAILIIQFLFKIQHWPFAGPISILATIGYIMIGISFIKKSN